MTEYHSKRIMPSASELIFMPARACCPLCGNEELSNEYVFPFTEGNINYDHCSKCGFIFSNPQLTNATMEMLYAANDYWGQKTNTGSYKNYLEMDIDPAVLKVAFVVSNALI